MKKLFPLLIVSVLFFSCDKDEDPSNPDTTPSEADIVEGLKEALKVGTGSAVGIVSVSDGYFKDEAIKLLLPDELENSINSFKSKSINLGLLGNVTGEDIYTTGIPSLNINPLGAAEDALVLGINRAAESAATEATPIFVDAITDMTVADGSDILFGGVDTAATAYLNDKTRPELFDNYEPKIDTALNSVKVGNKSVVAEYESFVSDYNSVLNTSVPLLGTISSLSGVNPVGATDLSAYSTTKGLDGLFMKVADEEKKIRTDPLARVTDILVSIFSLLD